MYTLENSRCDIIGFDANGIIGFYRHNATAITFKKHEEAVQFLNYLQAIGKYTKDISINKL